MQSITAASPVNMAATENAQATALPGDVPPRTQHHPLPARETCAYTASYCEENIYLLIRQLAERFKLELPSLFAVFISNRARATPLFQQRAGRGEHKLCLWDYHVLLLCRLEAAAGDPAGIAVAGAALAAGQQAQSTLVLDLDTLLPFPCPLPVYATEALQAGCISLPPELHRVYRVVPARLLLRHFASDRRHMLDEGGSWLASPPPYPPIVTPYGTANSLHHYLDMPEAEDAVDCATESAQLLAEADAHGPTVEWQQQQQQQQQQHKDEVCDLQYGVCMTERCFLEVFGVCHALGGTASRPPPVPQCP